ncbi:unnamed protein product, partial [Owenia fusiformis]
YNIIQFCITHMCLKFSKSYRTVNAKLNIHSSVAIAITSGNKQICENLKSRNISQLKLVLQVKEIMDLQALNALSEMLQTEEQDSESDDDQPSSAVTKMGPGSIGPAKKQSTTVKPSNGPNPANKGNSKDIWDEDEVNAGQEFDDVHDPRPQPEYDIVYKQAVTSEDMFLGMGNKNPATSSCEDMVVKIKLPGTKASEMQLDVQTKFLDCRTSKFKLGLHLPHPVDEKSGKAKWNSDKCELEVTLKMNRDYDFINF